MQTSSIKGAIVVFGFENALRKVLPTLLGRVNKQATYVRRR